MNLVMANHGREPVHLEEGVVHGEIEPATVIESNETTEKEMYDQQGKEMYDQQRVTEVALIVEGDGFGGWETELLHLGLGLYRLKAGVHYAILLRATRVAQ